MSGAVAAAAAGDAQSSLGHCKPLTVIAKSCVDEESSALFAGCEEEQLCVLAVGT